MNNQQGSQSADYSAATKGLQLVAKKLRDTTVTITHDDVSVTITAEPTIIDITISPSADIRTLPLKLKECLNEAFRESAKKMMQSASEELQNSV